MASVPASALSNEQRDELACTYAALILHDSGTDINAQNMANLIKASGCTVEGYWPMLMAKMIGLVGMDALIQMGSGAGGGGGGGGGATAGGGGGAGAAASGGGGEAKKEEKKVEEEEEEEDMDFDFSAERLEAMLVTR
eukprot:CAMPEP_0117562802 /NCGR_PEP_ID=MMETSP0784-20121206/55157_1 /TAXON_ID=39447 /ORGANISM="" /LENGTH=137 /DNA_ID=CAMNT_0005360409 /DNA_START=68 /DNA_END=482 /DNA_ORIENTATION=-